MRETLPVNWGLLLIGFWTLLVPRPVCSRTDKSISARTDRRKDSCCLRLTSRNYKVPCSPPFH